MFDLNNGKQLQAMMTPEHHELRAKAMWRLAVLGFFHKDEAKELQGFEITIEALICPWDDPTASRLIDFQITTVQHPANAFVITRGERIKGKRFDPARCVVPFVMCGENGMIFGKRGNGLYPDQFKLVLEKLATLDKEPIKRPRK